MSFDDESTPVFSGRWAPVVERRRRGVPDAPTVAAAHRDRPVRRAFAVAGGALVAAVSDIADDPVTPSPAERRGPHAEPPVDEPHEELDPH